jgi:hypothetical protein
LRKVHPGDCRYNDREKTRFLTHDPLLTKAVARESPDERIVRSGGFLSKNVDTNYFAQTLGR